MLRFRDLAERHVGLAMSAITAAADPSDFIDPAFLTEFSELAFITWAEGTSLIGALFGELPIPLFQPIVEAAVKESVSYYQQLLRGIINKKTYGLKEPIYGEFIRSKEGKNTLALVQHGDIRPLLVRLGGGSTDPTVPLMGGVASGHTMREWLRSNGIDTNKKIWLYGYDEPRRTFNGHLQMDGLVFESWEDDGLLIAPQDAWLRRSHYAPGDHWGCACVVAPWIPNFDAPYSLELPSV